MSDARSETFMARYIGQIVRPVPRWAGLPARLRIGSFSSDGTVRLYEADGRPVYTCDVGQLRDALRYGVLVEDAPVAAGVVSTPSVATLRRRLLAVLKGRRA